MNGFYDLIDLCCANIANSNANLIFHYPYRENHSKARTHFDRFSLNLIYGIALGIIVNLAIKIASKGKYNFFGIIAILIPTTLFATISTLSYTASRYHILEKELTALEKYAPKVIDLMNTISSVALLI